MFRSMTWDRGAKIDETGQRRATVVCKGFLCQIKTFNNTKIAQKVSISFLIMVIIQQMMFRRLT